MEVKRKLLNIFHHSSIKTDLLQEKITSPLAGDISALKEQIITSGKEVFAGEDKAVAVLSENLVDLTEQAVSKPSIKEIAQLYSDNKEPLFALVKEHPHMSVFLGSMVAGALTGLLEKKAEEKKEVVKYLEGLQKFTNKIVRRDLHPNRCLIKDILAGSAIFALPCWLLALTQHGTIAAGMFGVGMLGLGTALIEAVSTHRQRDKQDRGQFLSEDKRSLRTEKNKFVTITPAGDKLIFCRVSEEKEGNAFVPEREVELNFKADSLDIHKGAKPVFIHSKTEDFYVSSDGSITKEDPDKGTFYVRSKEGSLIGHFSLDGENLKL